MTQYPHGYEKKRRHDQLVASQKHQRMNTKNTITELCGTSTSETHETLLKLEGLKRSLYEGCCGKLKIACIKVQTSDKLLSLNVCMTHFDLDFIRKRQIVWRNTS